ncbi:MAG: hypothetical protein ACJ8KU_06165 [Chthoniobacterales bacterium]
MVFFVARVFRIRLTAAVVITALAAALALSQLVQQYRAEQARRIAADAQALQSVQSTGYGIETHNGENSSDQSWKSYCYRERATLIAEARAQSQ